MLALASEVGARVNADEDGTVQASAFKAEETGECDDGLSRTGYWELAWQVGGEA